VACEEPGAAAAVRDLLARGCGAIARRIEQGAPDRLAERDLERACVAVLRERAVAPVSVWQQGDHGLRERWPCLGPVDLCVGDPSEPPAFVELTCGSGSDALGPCAWDLVKLAVALDAGTASAGFLIAATTAARWERLIRGSELLEGGEWHASCIRAHFRDWWRHWQKDGGAGCADGYRPPSEVPSSFATSLVHRQPLVVGGTAWEIRVAEVVVTDPAPHRWQRIVPLPA
jgi:hypothetical protein